MNFLAKIGSEPCSICHEKTGVNGLVHEAGEEHPLHRKCLEVWMQKLEYIQTLTCPICQKSISSIETKSESFVRLAREGDEVAVEILMKKGPFPLTYGLAVCVAAEYGQTKIVEMLLVNGNISNGFCGMAIKKAAQNGHLAVIKTLLTKRTKRGEGIELKDLKAALQLADQNEHAAVAAKLQRFLLIKEVLVTIFKESSSCLLNSN